MTLVDICESELGCQATDYNTHLTYTMSLRHLTHPLLLYIVGSYAMPCTTRLFLKSEDLILTRAYLHVICITLKNMDTCLKISDHTHLDLAPPLPPVETTPYHPLHSLPHSPCSCRPDTSPCDALSQPSSWKHSTPAPSFSGSSAASVPLSYDGECEQLTGTFELEKIRIII